MNVIARFRRLSLWNKIGTLGGLASIAGLASLLLPRIPSDSPPDVEISSGSRSGPAFSINEVKDSTIVVGTDHNVGNTDSAVDSQRSLGHDTRESNASDYSTASVLAFQTSGEGFGFAAQVDTAWPASRVENVSADISLAFRNALEMNCEIVHLSIGFDDRALWFSQTDIISTEQFRDMFLVTGNTSVLILDGCGSFAIGKVLEEAGLRHLIVALPDAPAASVFFTSFYSQLARGVTPTEAVKRAQAEVRLQNGSPTDFSCTTF